MTKPVIDVATLALDELGRTLLPDELLDQIEASESMLSSGGQNACCQCGSTNGGCSNGHCDNTSNGGCINSISCVGATNSHYCVDGPIG
jgi:hypothetical protein